MNCSLETEISGVHKTRKAIKCVDTAQPQLYVHGIQYTSTWCTITLCRSWRSPVDWIRKETFLFQSPQPPSPPQQRVASSQTET